MANDLETCLIERQMSSFSRKARRGPDASQLFDDMKHQQSTLGHKRLLLRTDTVDWGDDAIEDEEVLGTCSTNGAIANFAMTLMGCSIMALPKVFASTGIVLGVVGMAIAVLLTINSASVIVRTSASTGIMSYAEMVRMSYGAPGALILQLCIIVNNMGVMIVYFIMIADLLIGTPTEAGLLPTLLQDFTHPWYLTRWFWITVVAIVFEAPLLYLRDLGSLLAASTASIFCSVFFSASLMTVAIGAAAQGKLSQFFIGPDPVVTGTAPLDIAGSFVAVLPVIALAFICHFNVLPIKASLKDRSRMLQVVSSGTCLIAIIYSCVALSGYVMFGRHTQGNVFVDFTAEYVGSIFGKQWALPTVVLTKLPVIYMLIITYVLKSWGVRECCSEVFFNSESLKLPLFKFYGITYTVLAVVWALACVLPSVFTVMLFIGSTACVGFSYVFPGLLLLVEGPTHRKWEGRAFLMIATLFAVLGLKRAFETALA